MASYSYERLQSEIAQGRILIVFESNVYDATSWIKRHPGGELVIRHCVGRDATDQMRVLHSREVLNKMLKSFYVGPLIITKAEAHLFNTPLSMAFRKLEADLHEEGFFETNFNFYHWHIAKFVTFLLAILLVLVIQPFQTPWKDALLAGILTGAMWQQVAFDGHDLGHSSVMQNRRIDGYLILLVANAISGISSAWWKDTHYVHHIITNDPRHDPDIQLLPVFAISTRFFNEIYSTYHRKVFQFDLASKLMVSIQHYLYYIIMAFGRVNLYVQSIKHLVIGRNVQYPRLELLGLLIFWTWLSFFTSILPTWSARALYLTVAHAVTFILHVQITLSHYAMPTEDVRPDEEFVKHQLKTTLDVDCPEWLDWFHGGLQFQTPHHLFPRMPRHNLRRARGRVMEFCREHGLTYNCESFAKGNGMVLGALKDVADQVKFYVKVASHLSDSDASH